MGTKLSLVNDILEVVSSAKPGVFLDAFSGMCSVGRKLQSDRPIWANDAQSYASVVAQAIFTTPPQNSALEIYAAVSANSAHAAQLSIELSDAIATEQFLCQSSSLEEYQKSFSKLENELTEWRLVRKRREWNLFTSRFGLTYFSLRQCIQIDTIRKSIELLSEQGRTIALAALGRAMQRTVNSPGHFAQFFKANENNYKRIIKQKRKNLIDEFCKAVTIVSEVSCRHYSSMNKVFCSDALTLVNSLSDRLSSETPALVYADPPYTADHYSRFYHLLETMVLYDYPLLSGDGQYRPNRFKTPFSIRSLAFDAINQFIQSVSNSGADLVLSYPKNGLLYKTGDMIEDVVSSHFKYFQVSKVIPYKHSTFGAANGAATQLVEEQIFWAHNE